MAEPQIRFEDGAAYELWPLRRGRDGAVLVFIPDPAKAPAARACPRTPRDAPPLVARACDTGARAEMTQAGRASRRQIDSSVTAIARPRLR